ncbi:Uncharacterised protein [Mycobacteroides abscessus subsp. abscessus]|nr:Uncharacterised protein [Mycobacteroides abscessus subsp. abscessus]
MNVGGVSDPLAIEYFETGEQVVKCQDVLAIRCQIAVAHDQTNLGTVYLGFVQLSSRRPVSPVARIIATSAGAAHFAAEHPT